MAKFARYWPLLALLACLFMLAVAHAFETFGHLAPCTLCLKERQIYWGALAIAAVAAALSFTPARSTATRIANVLLVIAFFYSAMVAGYHAGAEWKWWPGPASCSGGATHVNAADLTAFLNGAPMAMPACDKAVWIFLGLSMAGWNAVISLGLAGVSALAVGQGKSDERARSS
ncbi:MAG: disulfide bond formation protein B [Caulobacteraceae bacterium]